MTAGFVPPDHWTEVPARLRKSLTTQLDANGRGTVTFDTDHANQRWVITSVFVSTNQPSQSTLVPYATSALNTTDISQMSPGNQFGQSWTGNNDTFTGPIDVGPCDFYSVIWGPPTGQSGAPLAGVIATAVVQGTKYTRRA